MKSVALFLKNVFVPQKSHLFALLLGVISVFAFAPFDLSPIMLASVAGLFLLWLDAETRFEAAKIGLWFGLGQFGLGVSWLFSSMYFYSGVMLPVAVVLTFCFVLFLALSVALGGWIAQYFKNPNRPGLVLILLFPAVWVLIELVRSTIFGGFPFLLSGTTHLGTWLDGYAPVLGVWGVSWALAISAGLLLWLFKQKSWVTASVSLCLIWSVGGLLQNVQWVKPLGKPLEVALIQGNIAQEKKWLPNEFYPTLKTYIGLTKLNMDADVVVWPETAVPAYYDVVEQGALKSFIKDAKLLKTDILVGVIAGGKDSDNYYNALINVHRPEERYYKHHLVPFSEYFPFTSAFEFVSGLFDIPFATFTHGEKDQKPLMLGGQPAGLSICYEMAFGDELANQLPEAKYLITVSNDAWFANTFEPAQQLQEVRMRALELGREIARSTNTGYTAIVDIKGNIRQQIPAYETGVLRGKVQPYDGLTFYAEWKTMPVLFLLFTYFGFLLAKRYLQRGRFN
ncbi:apolipoprotein N-acyltransferase [Thiomicrorhabdus immobilis]|uniref:Apolipoprotein N-acyltransferase n=1 Tax=Thiomicrorhabdus immobilis TaxID=2791037 RepID=A0ABM7MF36_9GAMM|nr:apolipoprotein N-acyltransferase [Thiomicrorhabdus immobilis]BCN94024.1 apolipoprotein N-acyltransferase [Thiomicrorhabdus immobilis]